MFTNTPNYTKLKTNLRLSINRLKLLEKKKTELAQKARKEIADYIQIEKHERAKIRVEHIIREDYLVESMEIVEMFCDLLLARFGLITQMKNLDEGIAEAVASILWVAPRLQSDIQELKIVSDLLTAKYGKQYAEACRNEQIPISEKLKHKLSVQSPPRLLVEKYMIEISKSYDLDYIPDPDVMKEELIGMGQDSLLIDFSDKNNLGGSSGGNAQPQPVGFIGYPQPPLPQPFVPFNYPGPSDPEKAAHKCCPFSLDPSPTVSAPHVPNPPAFSYNIPPVDPKEDNTNVGFDLPPYNTVSPDDNLQNKGMAPKPQPRSKLPGSENFPDLPELPTVPSDSIAMGNEDIDFDDLTRRFEELKKKK